MLPEVCDAAPLSFNLMSHVTIVSSIPLAFTAHLSSLAESFGLNAFSRGNTIVGKGKPNRQAKEKDGENDEVLSLSAASSALESKCASFYAALCHYRHPQPLPHLIRDAMAQYGGVMPPPANASSGASSSDVQLRQFLQERISRWTQAFTSLYSMLRNGKCPYFYVRNSGKNSVLFQAYGVGGQDIRAVLNESSAKVREELEKYSIEYVDLGTMASEASQREGSAEQEVKRSTSSNNPHTLLFQGKRSVHALFNFLLVESCNGCLKWLRDDVPELLSSTPFIFGTLENVEVKQLREHSSVQNATVSGNTTISGVNKSRDGSRHYREEKKYVLHIAGVCMPHTIHHMCRVFQESLLETPSSVCLDPKLTLNFRVLPETSHLNCVIRSPSLYQAQHPFSKLLAHEASEEEYGYLDKEQVEELHDMVFKTMVMQVESGVDGHSLVVMYHTTVSDKVA